MGLQPIWAIFIVFNERSIANVDADTPRKWLLELKRQFAYILKSYMFPIVYRTTINDIQAKATNLQRAGTQQGGAVGYQDTDMKNNINAIVHDMKTLLNKPQVN